MKTRHAIGWAVLIAAGLLARGEAAFGQVSGSAATAAGPYTLEQCIQIAVQNNPQIEIARKQVEVQQAAVFGSYYGVSCPR